MGNSFDDVDDFDDEFVAALLEERAARSEPEADAVAARRLRFLAGASSLRANYHPKQGAFVSRREGRPRRVAACTTRQSGKTSGLNRELVARCLESDDQRWVYCISTREEGFKRAWRNDSSEGWIDLIQSLELEIAPSRREFDKGVGDVVIDGTYLTIDFRGGSQLDLFAADDEKAINKLRGLTKDGVVVDEAQQFPFLTKFVNTVVVPALAKRDGEIWLTGTPSEFQDGMFFDVTRDDELDKRLVGWEVHTWSILDNPGFGSTLEERYARTLGREIAERQLDPDNLPADFIREWLGRWVTTAARYVYRVHHLTDDDLCFAPVRETFEITGTLTIGRKSMPFSRILQLIEPLKPIAWYDHSAALADLPTFVTGTRRRIQWRFSLGADFGYHPHPFAVVLLGWSPLVSEIYEMWSWKRTRVIPDRQRDILLWFWQNVPEIDSLVGDPGGQAGANLEGWRQLTGLPIEDADKAHKSNWIEFVNNEIATRRKKYRRYIDIGPDGQVIRRDSALLDEHKHLMWRLEGKTKLVEHDDRRLSDGRIPGNDCSDADLYPTRGLIGRRLDPTYVPLAPGSQEWFDEQETRAEAAIDVGEPTVDNWTEPDSPETSWADY